MRAFRRPMSLIAALAGAVLLLGACSVQAPAEPSVTVTQESANVPSTSPSASGSLPKPGGVPKGLEKFYAQELKWSACGGVLQCAELSVPMDYSHPEGPSISISMNKRPGKNVKGSLLLNPGGPGASGLEFVKDSATVILGRNLQRNFDIIGFDPRGVGSSTPVKCETAEQQDASRQLPVDTSTDAGLAQARKLSAEFAAQCAERTGDSLGFIDTKSAARDIDVMRAALGDLQLNYLGYSYGTSLGAHYAQLFPQNVGRLVLDGAIDPSLSNDEITLGQAAGFEGEVRAYMQNCLASGDCPFTGTLDDGLSQLRDLLSQVEKEPLVASDGRTVPIIDFVNGFILPLYDDAMWPMLSSALSDVIAGDVDNIQFFSDISAGREDDGTYTGNTPAAFVSINCLDYPMDASVGVMRANAEELLKASPTLGKYLAYGAVTCESWKFPPTGKPGVITAAGAQPIVVIGTTGDPATPYEWSEALAEQLESASLVTFEGHGHTAYGRSNECVSNAVESYFLEGTVPSDGLTC
ncbi:alpha/beta hydrolase [Arthrobacter sp. MYb227]|uniref:alpha/beta hydrolase n=1 Tax=Arthrobacter sp. MYb227 TaxID=1848601 RepID=UPI000CFCA5C6|nr:alpha/beta hydrolase [Arthrobacter sp. MYb227]PQZ85952.1 alpha/beta hydrolase [Arthrobacter sp. MYb227]